VLAVVTVEPIMLATDAGEDPADTAGKLLGDAVQVSACALEAANNATTNVIAIVAPIARARQPEFLSNPLILTLLVRAHSSIMTPTPRSRRTSLRLATKFAVSNASCGPSLEKAPLFEVVCLFRNRREPYEN
jgi:hypothetical protein